MASVQPKTFTARSGEEFVIRTVQPDDAEAMLAYVRGVVEETDFFVIEPDELPPTVDEEGTWIQGHLDHPGKILLLAETQGCIIGNVRLESGPYRRIAHRGTLSMAVVKEWRGGGEGARQQLRAVLVNLFGPFDSVGTKRTSPMSCWLPISAGCNHPGSRVSRRRISSA